MPHNNHAAFGCFATSQAAQEIFSKLPASECYAIVEEAVLCTRAFPKSGSYATEVTHPSSPSASIALGAASWPTRREHQENRHKGRIRHYLDVEDELKSLHDSGKGIEARTLTALATTKQHQRAATTNKSTQDCSRRFGIF